ncbi:pPIWI_RE_Y domain-containing protein [Streptomyces sp. NPDC054863]
MRSGEDASLAAASGARGEGTEIFVELARVVIEMADRAGLASLTLPYPRAAQLALDRMVLHCLGRTQEPPESVPDLMAWCARLTADQAPFHVPSDLVAPGTRLIHPAGRMPTRTCQELASFGDRGHTEQEAVRLLADLASRCRSAEEYARCRRFLRERPVVGQGDRFEPRWKPMEWNRVKDLYVSVPESLLRAGILHLCGACGLPALPGEKNTYASDEESWCESEECPPGVSYRLIREPGLVRMLRRSLRSFLLLPAPTEAVALEALKRAGVTHTLVAADLGTYRIADTGMRPRLMRVYDRQQPALLAARLIDTFDGSEGPLLAVVPRRRAGQEGYRRAFERALGDQHRGLAELTTPEELAHHLGTPHTSRKGLGESHDA